MKVVAVKVSEEADGRYVTVYGSRGKNRRVLMYERIEGKSNAEVKALVRGLYPELVVDTKE